MARTPGPWQWSIMDYSMAILHGADVMEDAVLDVGPCPSCAERIKERGGQWEWRACTVPSKEDADFIVRAVNNHDPMLAALRAARAKFELMWPGREPASDTAWQAVVEAIHKVENG